MITQSIDDNRLWLQRAQWLLRTIISGGVGLKVAYLNGLAYNEAFLNAFKVKAFLFSFADNELYVNAYVAAVYGLSGWFEFMTNSLVPLVTTCAVTSLVWFAPTVLRCFAALGNKQSLKDGPSRSRPWVAKVAEGIGANAFAIFLFFYLPLLILLSLIAVPAIGSYAGKHAAAAKMETYMRGCKYSATKGEFCYVLLDKGKELARGFPIVRGDGKIALWWQGEARIEETAGRSLRTLADDK
ncbi:hypothetical protein RA280_46470 [Cupriavidus sp. CV2]|uniref:hypothetical protein n=1 Tax=Cupriavidus ulmosensis TaxID=3065913 RepID=UPI00296B2FCB|nr:hypothetical protein [Cupriavidus sp. CV2]MDW3689039.1 hypothetical protein [Cupriavidus sp. CV2]